MFSKLRLAFMASAVIAVGLLVPNTASAAGGGCLSQTQYPVSGGRPWTISSCSADNGGTVFADGYVDVVGSTVGSCQLRVGLLDRTTGALVTYRNDTCYAGHHPAVSGTKVAGHRYVAQLRMNTNQSYTYWNSKETT
jgi:hypothetical protein